VTETTKKKRKGSLAAKAKHLDWIMAWLVRTQPCAICGKSLLEGYNPRYPGKCITLHHNLGSREVDEWDNPEYVAHMVLCHKTCHRSYHMSKRHSAAGRAANITKLSAQEELIAKVVRRQIPEVQVRGYK
jgi:hypothetical protein